MIHRINQLVTTLALSCVATGAAIAQDANEVYDRFAEHITGVDRMSVDMNLDFHVAVDSQTESMSLQMEIAFERPKSFAYKMVTPDVDVEFYGDGVEIVTFIPSFDQYIVSEQMGTASEILGSAGFGPTSDAMMIVSELTADEPFANLLAVADSVEYVAQETIRGGDYDRVRVVLDGFRWDAWFATGENPTLFRIAPQIDSLNEHFGTMGEDVTVDIVIDFDNWKFGESVSGDQLAFLPGDAAIEVNEFARPTPAMQLLGRPAPAISLAKIDGTDFDLASLQGDEIVVLDFWATWCGPCRTAMPIIERVTNEFAERGVRLYAVNLQEDAETINAFLVEEDIDVTVVMDTNGQAAGDYRAEAIPQTVIIDRDGTVQAVHVGVSPNLEQQLRSELQTLVDGGSLVSR